jgi:hypothetical protein
MLKDNDPRLAKLPKWAQGEFERLQQKVEDSEKRVAELSARPEDTDTLVHDYVRTPIPLPPGSRVRFVLDEHNYIEAHLETHSWLGRLLQVRSSGSASGTILVRPGGANSVSISVDAR